jgi:hypothetical protein
MVCGKTAASVQGLDWEQTNNVNNICFHDYLLTLGKENFLLKGIMCRLENTIEDVTIKFNH